MVVEGECYDGPCKLLELPHYVLRILFSYLDATSLYFLSRTCNYMKEFILDPLFWKHIDARDDPNICDKIEYCTNRVHKKTARFYIRGNLNFADLPKHFFSTVKPFDNLKVLAIENVKLKGKQITLKDFPSALEELSLRRTYVKNSEYFFQHSHRNMPKLRVLILDECSWVTCSFILSVCKYDNLEIISVVKCLRIHMNMIPYLNVAKIGCKKLKIFDCRFTAIGGELLRTFYLKENLQSLYFQSLKSAEVDYEQQNFGYGHSSRQKHSSEPYTDMSIADVHLREYLMTYGKPKNEVEPVGDSFLYQDPYPECACGGEGPRSEELITNITFPDDELVHVRRGEAKFLCSKHMKDIVNLPQNFKDFFLTHHQQFSPAPDIHMDFDSDSSDDDNNQNEEEEGCCYFGMGTSLIIPSTHDRTPSAGEEMSLPGEGARNQSYPRLLLLNPTNRNNNNSNNNRDRSSNSSPNTSRSNSDRRNSFEEPNVSRPSKRRHDNSDGENSSESAHGKKTKKSSTDGVSNEVHEVLVNQLLESVDHVSSKIEKLVDLNPEVFRRANMEYNNERPSTSGFRNGGSDYELSSSDSDDTNDTPSCSKTVNPVSPDRDKNNENFNDETRNSNNNSRSNNNNIERSQRSPQPSPLVPGRRIALLSRYVLPGEQKRLIKGSIPLKRLSLRGFRKITDSTLNYLKNLDMDLIDLTYTSVTKNGIENFLVQNPNCRVIHPLYCICKPKNPLL